MAHIRRRNQLHRDLYAAGVRHNPVLAAPEREEP